MADIAAGMYAYTGVLTALLRRHRTGEGATIEVSMLEALAEWMGFPLNYAMYGGTPPPRSGAAHAAIAPYGPFPCAGGRQVFLGIQNEREWATFCATVLEQPELTDDERFATNTLRVAHRDELTAVRRRRSSPTCWRTRSSTGWSAPGSPTPGCGTWPSWPPTPSSRPATGGARSGPRSAR